MLPVVQGEASTAQQIWIYTLALLPISLLLVYPLGVMGAVYTGGALALGIVFISKAWSLMQTPTDQQMARSLFKYSILYMMLLCTGMAIDSLPVTQTAIATLTEQMNTLLSTAIKLVGACWGA